MGFSFDTVFDYIIIFVSLSEVSLENANHIEGKSEKSLGLAERRMLKGEPKTPGTWPC